VNKKRTVLWVICLSTIIVLVLFGKYLPENGAIGMIKAFVKKGITPYTLISGYLIFCVIIIAVMALVLYYLSKIF